MSKGPWEKEQKGMEICRMLAAGHKKQEIAKALHISSRTVCARIDGIRQQFDVKTTYELIATLAKNGEL